MNVVTRGSSTAAGEWDRCDKVKAVTAEQRTPITLDDDFCTLLCIHVNTEARCSIATASCEKPSLGDVALEVLFVAVAMMKIAHGHNVCKL